MTSENENHSFELVVCFQVADPWGGSYMMESLTDEVYNSAKKIIDEVRHSHSITFVHVSLKLVLKITCNLDGPSKMKKNNTFYEVLKNALFHST